MNTCKLKSQLAACAILALGFTGVSQAAFVDSVITGLPFASVQGHQGYAPSASNFAIDGFVDSNSRWSYSGNGTLELSLPLGGWARTRNPTANEVFWSIRRRILNK